jgi:hypothetical protein
MLTLAASLVSEMSHKSGMPFLDSDLERVRWRI